MKLTYSLQQVVDAGNAPSVRWLQTQIRAGNVGASKIGRSWRMTDDDIDDMLATFRNTSNVREIAPGALSAVSARRRAAS